MQTLQIMQFYVLKIVIKTVFSAENIVPPIHQLVQDIECRQGSYLQSL